MRHNGGSFQRVRDIRALWEAVLAAEKAAPPISEGPGYPLAASKALIEESVRAERKSGNQFGASQFLENEERLNSGHGSPRAQFSREELLMDLAVFLFPGPVDINP
jgi:hypothetical protein